MDVEPGRSTDTPPGVLQGLNTQVMPEANQPLGTNPVRLGTLAARHALQQMVEALGQPSSSQRKDQITQILKSQPQLTAAFFKFKQRQQQQAEAQLQQQEGQQPSQDPQPSTSCWERI